MRTSRIAVTVCTGLLGLGTLVTQAVPAFAGPTPPMVLDQGGDSIEVGPPDFTTPTTQPTPDIPEMDLVLPEDEPDFEPPLGIPGEPSIVVDPSAGDGECEPGTVPDPDCPQPEDECEPVPGAADCPGDEPCIPDSTIPVPPWEQCPEDECPEGPIAAAQAQEDPCLPCDEDHEDGPTRNHCPSDECIDDEIARAQIPPTADGGTDTGGTDTGGDGGEPCEEPCEQRPDTHVPREHHLPECPEPCVPEDERPERPEGGQRHLVPEDEDCPETGTDGGDGGTDGDGRLPKTGGEILAYAGAGLGLTGLGALLKRLGRREEA